MDIQEFKKSFEEVEDFRQEGKVRHKLINILFIGVVATIANANTFLEIGTFAVIKEEWLRKYIDIDNGVPSHDTIQRVFEHLDSKAFGKAFIEWTNKLSDHTSGRIIAIDGKTVRRSFDGDKKPVHLVNAWVDKNDLILGQIRTSEKSNEITAIPELLELLFIKDSIVTIDAMGTQKKIAEKIIKKKGDYVLALKGNHETFHKEVEEYLKDAINNDFKDVQVSRKTTLDKGHGRIEKREYIQTNDIEWFSEKKLWKALKSIGMVRRTVIQNGKETVEISYYISSLEAPVEGECELFAKAIRKHWGVESCHWMLDVLFKEDNSLVRKNNGAENLSMLRKLALNILKEEVPGQKKMSKNMKRFTAGLDEKFLDLIVQNI